MLEDVSRSVSKGGSEESQKQVAAEDTRTPAQIAYDKIQEKRVCTDVYIIIHIICIHRTSGIMLRCEIA